MSTDALTLKVGRMLASAGIEASVTEDGFRIFYGSTALDVDIVGQQTRTLVKLVGPVVFGAPENAELTRWVAVDGQRTYFGSAALRPRGDGAADVFIQHTLLGDFLDEGELLNAVAAVVKQADEWDDLVRTRFGGKRVDDL
jgi:hypothetical protein